MPETVILQPVAVSREGTVTITCVTPTFDVPLLAVIVTVGVPTIVPAVTILKSITSVWMMLTAWPALKSVQAVTDDGLNVQVRAVSAPFLRKVTVKPVDAPPRVALIDTERFTPVVAEGEGTLTDASVLDGAPPP